MKVFCIVITLTCIVSSVFGESCKDEYEMCQTMGKRCQEDFYKYMMKSNCPKTCKYCKSSSSDCKDRKDDCHILMHNPEFCSSNQYAKDNCRKSCGLCSSHRHHGEEKNEDGSSKCENKSSACRELVKENSNFCVEYKYAKASCRKACGLCSAAE